MPRRRFGCLLGVMISGLVLSAAVAQAQTGESGSIAGVVRDTSGLVLPGVTVQAASPALIEKVRIVVTDGQGLFRIVDLRPGTYTVTFSLEGFSTVSRAGVELTTGFTATVNAEMAVGSINETVSVTGASPIVDVQNVRTQNVLTRAELEVSPIVTNYSSFATMTLGASGGLVPGAGRDVGGGAGEGFLPVNVRGVSASSSVEGLRITGSLSSGTTRQIAVNPNAIQEVVLQTSGVGAENEDGGALNMVLKDGQNTFHGVLNGDYTGRHLQGNNLSDALRARGLDRPNIVTKLYDIGGGLGGRIVHDKLWFYTAHRKWGGNTEIAGVYFNKTQDTLFYTPDLSRPGSQDNRYRDSTGRLTWQASQKQKITGLIIVQDKCVCYYFIEGTRGPHAPEATTQFRSYPSNVFQGGWTYTPTSRLLVEAAMSVKIDGQENTRVPETSLTAQPVIELSTGLEYGSFFSGSKQWYDDYGVQGTVPLTNARAAVTYVTGSHAFRTGVTFVKGAFKNGGNPIPVQYQFRNQLPVGLTQTAAPNFFETRLKYNIGLYGQDQWTLRRLTLNLGLRFDMLNEYTPFQTRPGGLFVPEVRYDPVYNIPNWKDINPRLGAAYDIFGNGKTAIKVSLGRYNEVEFTTTGQANNPGAALSGTTSRIWADTNRNFFPDCDLTSRLANGECGQTDQAFGTTVRTRTFDPDLLEGWGVRAYRWQGAASFSHELRPGVGVEFSSFRTSYGNIRATINREVTAADFDSYCVKAPVDARLPGGGGYEVCGIYDIKPEAFGRARNSLVTDSSNVGEQTRVFTGVEARVNARFGRGGFLSGGIASGRQVTDSCSLSDRPDVAEGNKLRTSESEFCHAAPPWQADTQVKFNVSYLLPFGFQTGMVFQFLPGIARTASYVVTNAEAARSLGRNLGSCGARVVCNATAVVSSIAPPGSMYEKRQSQVDVRVSRDIRIGLVRLRPRVDIYNLFQDNGVQALTTRYGPLWLNPISVLSGRMVKFGAQLDF